MKRACMKPWKFVTRHVVRAVRRVTTKADQSSADPTTPEHDEVLQLYKDGVALDMQPKQAPEPYYQLPKEDEDSKSKILTDVAPGIDLDLYQAAQLEMIRKNQVDGYDDDVTYYTNVKLIASQFGLGPRAERCSFGLHTAVYKAYREGKPNQEAAFKVVSCKYKTANYHQFWKMYAAREMYFLNQLDHQNVIKMYQFMWLDSSFLTQGCLVMDLECMDMDLADLAKKVGPINDDKLIARVAVQVLSALEHMHAKLIAHHDIKESNMLLAPLRYEWRKNGVHNMQKLMTATLKIGDFSAARRYSSKDSKEAEQWNGTRHYFSPEKDTLNMTPYDPFKADLYALGVSLLKLTTGKYWTAYADADDASQVAIKVLDVDGSRPVHDAILAMLSPEATRPAVEQVLKAMQAQL